MSLGMTLDVKTDLVPHPKTVDCPRCGVKAGQACITLHAFPENVKRAHGSHRPRIDAAKKGANHGA